MKLSTATLAAIATAAAVNGQAIPVAQNDARELQAREFINELEVAVNGITASLNKREFETMNEAQLMEFVQRDLGSAISQLISAFLNLGILGDIWNTITTNQALKDQVFGLVKLAVSGLFAALPNLLSAIWNSGLIQNIFSKLVNDTGLQQAILNLIKEAVSAIFGALTGGSSTQKRELDALFEESLAQLQARDVNFGDLLANIIKTVWDSGIVQLLFNSIVNWIKTNPDQFQAVLKQALSVGWSLVQTLYNWAKNAGLIDAAFKWLGANIGNIITWVINLISSLFGGSSNAAPAQQTQQQKRQRMMY